MSELKSLWRDSGYAGLSTFWKYVKSNTNKYKYNDIKQFYNEQQTQQLHKPIEEDTSKYKPIVTVKDCFDFQLDLLDMSKYSRYNKGYKWIMICVDVFSRKAYTEPLKNKGTKETARAFNNILESLDCVPFTITTDDGSEYKGEFKKVLEKNKINQRIKDVGYHRSLGVIDRFSRTIKTILSKMFTELDSVNWIDHLDKMTTAYNNRPHNGVCGMSPIEAEKYKEDTIRCHLEKIKILHYMISRLVIL